MGEFQSAARDLLTLVPMSEAPEEATSVGHERAELWRWVHQLERFAEMGLHARGLAHDMGNTLTSLMAGLELALLAPDDTDLRAAVTRGLDLSKNVSKRLHAYLDFTRRANQTRPALLLEDAVEDAIRIIAHPVRKSGATVTRCFEDGVRVDACRPHVVQAVSNAALAVIEACALTGPTIEFVITRIDGEAVLEIRGHESTKEDAPRAAPATTDTERTGLELTIAHRVMAGYGGRFAVSPVSRQAHVALPTSAPSQAGDDPRSEALATWRAAWSPDR